MVGIREPPPPFHPHLCRGMGLGASQWPDPSPSPGLWGWGLREGLHTDLLLVAKQLGDEGRLSKNLQEREGEG